MSIEQAETTDGQAAARSVDDFLADLDAVLADSTVVPPQVVEPVPDLDVAAAISDGTAEAVLPPAEPLRPPVAQPSEEARIRRDRLPNWWERKSMDVLTTNPGEAEKKATVEKGQAEASAPVESKQPEMAGPKGKVADKCLHLSLLALRAEADQGDGEVVARLCLDCDEQLPPTDPEPKRDCAHEQRLEARSESGKLIGYVCAAEGCGARLSVEEVHGRVGKWLRPAAEYYPRIRNPFSPAVGADGEEVKPALSPGTLQLLANAGAAGAGYVLGLVPLLGTWIEECGRTISIGGALFLGGSICLVVAHFWDRRTRHWNPLLAWVTRIPLASAITALALYAPASQI